MKDQKTVAAVFLIEAAILFASVVFVVAIPVVDKEASGRILDFVQNDGGFGIQLEDNRTYWLSGSVDLGNSRGRYCEFGYRSTLIAPRGFPVYGYAPISWFVLVGGGTLVRGGSDV